MALLGVIAGAAVVGGVAYNQNHVPVYRGRPVREWMVDLGEQDKTRKSSAEEALIDSGAKSVPYLMRVLKSDQEDAKTRSYAARALGFIGSPSKPALPVLLKFASDEPPPLGLEALFALGKIPIDSDKVLPLFMRKMNDKDSKVRRRAAINLSRIDLSAKQAVPLLFAACSDRDKGVRIAATNTLIELGVPPPPAKAEEAHASPPPP
jgi:HEAT repeat protein